jgi:putative hydrolase of HD superfamily
MRLDDQLAFILEIDKLKSVQRRTILTDASRAENSSEHSWHIAVMAGLLQEYAAAPVDTQRVIQMLLVHDVVEVDAGDTYAYDAAGNATKVERELAAADRIFGLLPPDQRLHHRALWDEFEEMRTPESRYANALDRIQAALLNFHSGGIAWRQHGIRASQVIERMQPVKDGAPGLWPVVERIVGEATEKGYLTEG